MGLDVSRNERLLPNLVKVCCLLVAVRVECMAAGVVRGHGMVQPCSFCKLFAHAHVIESVPSVGKRPVSSLHLCHRNHVSVTLQEVSVTWTSLANSACQLGFRLC